MSGDEKLYVLDKFFETIIIELTTLLKENMEKNHLSQFYYLNFLKILKKSL